MKNGSRTNNALKNTIITIVCHIIYLICTFACRTVFTNTLGAEYLGIGGLFSNILTILSFAELGLGSTLVYHLYKPFSEKDYKKISAYVQLYKKIYSIIIIIILLAGVLVIPFLGYLVEAPNVKESLVLLYLLYLAQTITSYVYVYKKTVLTADQKDYIVTLFTEITNVVMNIIQCILLIIYKDFVLYCVLHIVFSLINNILCSLYVNKRYKEINKENTSELSNEEIKQLKTDAKGLIMTKVASTAFSGTDNIFISTFIGIRYVGILSNYTMLLTVINTMMNKVFSSITASIGNLVVSKDSNNKTESVLKRLFFINTSIYTYVCLGMMVLIGEFVTTIWFNSEYYLPYLTIILIVTELYLRAIHYPLYTMRTAMGLFSQYKVFFVLAAFLNIGLDFLLIKPLGISGLIIATILCRGITYMLDIHAVYKHGFKSTSTSYYKMVIKWIIMFVLCYVTSYFISGIITDTGVIYFVIKGIIITLIYLIFYLLFFFKTDEMNYFLNMINNKILKRKVKEA